MTEAEAYRRQKLDREERLRWQSRVLLAVVVLPAAAAILLQSLPVLTPASREGLILCAAFGLLVWGLRAATPLAAVTGFVLTGCLYLGTVTQPDGGWFHTALLPGLALFVLAFAATRFRRAQKEHSGLAESRRGRSASQVAANMGTAALAAVASIFSQQFPAVYRYLAEPVPAFLTAIVAALAEAAADTVASEVGQAVGGLPILLTNGRRVPSGTDGAITLRGSAAGCAAAAVIVLAAIPTLQLTGRESAVAFAAAVCGLFADSLIGATLESRGWLNNDAVNFLSTAIAALLALALSQ